MSIVVATSVLAEGIDIPSCGLVLCHLVTSGIPICATFRASIKHNNLYQSVISCFFWLRCGISLWMATASNMKIPGNSSTQLSCSQALTLQRRPCNMCNFAAARDNSGVSSPFWWQKQSWGPVLQAFLVWGFLGCLVFLGWLI